MNGTVSAHKQALQLQQQIYVDLGRTFCANDMRGVLYLGVSKNRFAQIHDGHAPRRQSDQRNLYYRNEKSGTIPQS